MSRLMRESIWIVGLAAVALLLTWAYFDFDWPADPVTSFYAPYSVYTVAPWPLAGALFAGLVGLRIFVRWRRRRRLARS